MPVSSRRDGGGRNKRHQHDDDDGDDDDDSDNNKNDRRQQLSRSGSSKKRNNPDDDDDDHDGNNHNSRSPIGKNSKRQRQESDHDKGKRSNNDDGNSVVNSQASSSSSSVVSSDEEGDRKRQKRGQTKRTSALKGGKGRRKSSKSRRREKKNSSKKTSSRRKKKSKSKKKRRYSSSSSSSSSDSSDDDSSSSSASKGARESGQQVTRAVVMNEKLLAKLSYRGETLEERKERRGQKRAAKIQSRFGYTPEDNPFNDPNLHETFVWNKKKEKASNATATAIGTKQQNPDTIEEIETIRRRRKEREVERDEMDRLRAEESRMKELENYDDWAKKEEEFHLEQQRKRSAIRLVEGREKPVDILAKNVLLFGLTDEEKQQRAAVKYQERYNALEELQKLDAELEEPHKIVSILKLVELQELLVDIEAFRVLEKEAMGGEGNTTIIMYWDALGLVVKDEIKLLQNGGEGSAYAKKVDNINSIFEGQSSADLIKMREEIAGKLSNMYNADGTLIDIDRSYWLSVMEQTDVHLAKMDLSELHSKMLVRQLEKLELRKEELLLAEQKRSAATSTDEKSEIDPEQVWGENSGQSMVPTNVAMNFGNLEEELGLTDEVAMASNKAYSWQDRYAPRKPRYFNRVRTGFDWNKYNQTHYDSENPPPKIVQGYKFNIFYPDLVDPTVTPQYFLEKADSNEFCILRFHAGPPYEDIAFKIINREWNRSRKRGFRSTFERGVLSLYFNFASHWYRR
jgi:hypothetical protein